MNNILIFDVSKLMTALSGSSEHYSFQGPVKFEGIEPASDLSGKLQIMRIEDGLNAKITDLEISARFECQRCLKSFTQKVKVKHAERQYYFHRPKHLEDPNDFFMVDTKNQKIDISEPFRQEIILHFPSIPVCSTSCKGICSMCGQNLNGKNCNCSQEEHLATSKPLAVLKDLIKE